MEDTPKAGNSPGSETQRRRRHGIDFIGGQEADATTQLNVSTVLDLLPDSIKVFFFLLVVGPQKVLKYP
jgi:hypothetical protein